MKEKGKSLLGLKGELIRFYWSGKENMLFLQSF